MTLKELRERANLKAEAAAYKLDISMSTLRNWESGKTQPTMNPEQYANAIEVYKCTYEEFRQATKETIEQATERLLKDVS